MDYALRYRDSSKVFIEVKKPGEDLEKHQEQLLNYSFQQGVKLATLTNGITWWFYLPLNEGSWEQRKFYTIEIYEQEYEEISQKFIDFLSKESVTSGKAIENAENVYKSRQKQSSIKETLPKAWTKIIEGPDEILLELISETTEKLCGYKPDAQTVENFISSNIRKQPLELKTTKVYLEKDKSSVLNVLKSASKRNHENIIKIDPKWPENFKHTKIIEGQFENNSARNWNGLVRVAILTAFHKGKTLNEINKCGITGIIEGEKNDEGYQYLREANVSIQNVEANRAYSYIFELAKELSSPFRIRLKWHNKDNAAHPGEEGLIEWNELTE